MSHRINLPQPAWFNLVFARVRGSVMELDIARGYNALGSFEKAPDEPVSEASLQVTNMVSFDYYGTGGDMNVWIHTSHGKKVHNCGRQGTYQLEASYTGLVRFTLALENDPVDNYVQRGIVYFEAITVLAEVIKPAGSPRTRTLPLSSFTFENGEICNGGETILVSNWAARGMVQSRVAGLISFDLDVSHWKWVDKLWLETDAGRQALEMNASHGTIYRHEFKLPYTGNFALVLDAQDDADLSGHILLNEFLCIDNTDLAI